MKPIWKWIKWNWKAIVVVFVWLAACLIVFMQKGLQKSDKFLVSSIISLVFITWFYAIQTQMFIEQGKISIEEDKKKRYADFGEKRIKEFLIPIREKLLNPELFSAISAKDKELIQEKITDINIFYYDYRYLTSPETSESILKLINDVENLLQDSPLDKKKGFIKKFWKSHFDTIAQIDREISSIEDGIREVYQYLTEVILERQERKQAR